MHKFFEVIMWITFLSVFLGFVIVGVGVDVGTGVGMSGHACTMRAHGCGDYYSLDQSEVLSRVRRQTALPDSKRRPRTGPMP